ncbi:GspH/FimT family pseudopilin [Pseudidiomarina sp. E22-M8]|uniref:GspH/FimT family pseudopilin n=1 Tax=Pseudidiomarina sp. E22-M8 TaxID=3424768 RepID=UPI00403C6188
MTLSVIPQRGFTLLELLVTLVILSIILGAGVPMMLGLAKSMRLQGAAQDTYALLQYARSDALRTTENRFVVWDEATSGEWCAAVATTNGCDCMTEDCSINGVLRQINSADYTNVSVNAAFAAGDYTRFDGMRGLAEGHAGSAQYQLMDGTTVEAEVRVVVSLLGRIRYCTQSGDIGDYPAC